jgi:energy-coupling factor transporter transmembrane protein EcfT
MISQHCMKLSLSASFKERNLGAVAYLGIFIFSVVTVMVTPAWRLPWAAAICLLVALLVYPHAFRSLMRLRWLGMIILLALPPIFLLGDLDRSLAGIPYSSEGLLSGMQIALRILVVLVAIQGLTSSVDISSVAGLLERAGLHGLGFSVGVALNLLPALLQSALNAWRSLWMRGGLRKQRGRGLRLLAVTVIAGALSRAEEIALAAEARAYSPERSRSMPIRIGKWDWAILGLGLIGMIAFVLIPG